MEVGVGGGEGTIRTWRRFTPLNHEVPRGAARKRGSGGAGKGQRGIFSFCAFDCPCLIVSESSGQEQSHETSSLRVGVSLL